MRIQRHTFMAGIAALALVAGTGFASGQETGKDQNAAQGERPHAATQQMNKAPATGAMGQNAQEQNRPEGKMSGNAQEQSGTTSRRTETQNAGPGSEAAKANFGKGHTAQTERSNRGRTAGREDMHQGMNARATARREGRSSSRNVTAQRERSGMKGLQGNASGVNVQLNDKQRTQIRETVIDARGAPRADNVNFDVTVGTAVPRGSIRIAPVPTTLVRIEPAWRGYRYFVWEDSVVIVSPRDMKIVAVVHV